MTFCAHKSHYTQSPKAVEQARDPLPTSPHCGLSTETSEYLLYETFYISTKGGEQYISEYLI